MFAITASNVEYDSYIKLATDNSQLLAKSYLAYFGDIYLSNPRLLPEFDIVTMFHLCEFIAPNTASAEYGGMDDRGLLDLLSASSGRAGILFYTGSNGWLATKPSLGVLGESKLVRNGDDFKTLLVCRKIG